jgi:hypothetical protein
MSESALIVPVPEAEHLVQSYRERLDPAARLGVPAHVTVLYPFLSRDLVDAHVLSRVRDLIGAIASFSFSLARAERFPDVTYLAPEPAAQFVRLTEAVVAEFPDHPPYGGQFAAIVPHLTVAHGPESVVSAVQRELGQRLTASGPVASVCRSVRLIENSSGIWRAMDEFPLADR